MNSNLKVLRIEPHTPEWYKFRMDGLGGSDVPSIWSPDKWHSALLLFHQKVGNIPTNTHHESEATFHGTQMEDYIAKCWKHFDPTTPDNMTSYINNFGDKVMRKCKNVQAYIVNPKYPWLFASPDRLMNVGSLNLLTQEPMDYEAVLEIKTIEKSSAAQWKTGIPTAYFIQVHVYMIVMEVDYAEIVILKDGRYLEVVPVKKSESLAKSIIDDSYDFWYNRVIPARKAMAEKQVMLSIGDVNAADECEGSIQLLEPDADGSVLLSEFLSDSYIEKQDGVPGSALVRECAIEMKNYNALIKSVNAKKSALENEIKREFVRIGARVFDFPDGGGYVRYFKKAGGNNYQLGNYVNYKPDFKQFNINGERNEEFDGHPWDTVCDPR